MVHDLPAIHHYWSNTYLRPIPETTATCSGPRRTPSSRSELPAAYRYNVMLRRHEETYLDGDCSGEGFEGIRAQGILPRLRERFGFELFLGFANVIDAFIGRCFGPHFDPARTWDREFIDRVHAQDEAEILAGNISRRTWPPSCAATGA